MYKTIQKDEGKEMEALSQMNYGWLSVVPPLVAIILALITKEVISSLIIGILTGALIYKIGRASCRERV